MKRLWIFIFFLALLLRLVLLDQHPRGFTPDEASFGYDAYSILLTGKDQWGNLPFFLKSFGDYKPPIYSLLAVPSIALFGLTVFSVRLPNAIIGSMAVIVFYFLILEIFEYEKGRKSWFGDKFNRKKYFVGTLASFLLAISPWHIALSRGAFESNLTTFFMTLGIYLFMKFINAGNRAYLFTSFIAFGINLLTYHSAKFVTPAVVATAILLFREPLLKMKKDFFISISIFVIFLSLAFGTFFVGAGRRVFDVSIANISVGGASVDRTRAIKNGLDATAARIFHNKYQFFVKSFLSNYLSYLSPQFMFTRGAGERTYGMSDDRGVFYWFELPLMISFVVWLIRTGWVRAIFLFFVWFLLSPIPASLALGPGFAANRAAVMLPSVYLFLAIGAYELSVWCSRRLGIGLKLIIFLGGSFVFIFFFAFVENYFFVAPSKIAKDMLYGNFEAVKYVSSQDRTVVVSTKLSEPHIYVAFVEALDPRVYQEYTKEWRFDESGLGWVDQLSSYRLGNYIFESVTYDKWKNSGAIIVGRPEEFSPGVVPLKKFSSEGVDLVYVVDTLISNYASDSR